MSKKGNGAKVFWHRGFLVGAVGVICKDFPTTASQIHIQTSVEKSFIANHVQIAMQSREQSASNKSGRSP